MDWLQQLVNMLATGTCTLEQAKTFLAARPPDVVEARAYPLTHIQTPVAVDLVFAEDARPSLADLAMRLGDFGSVPRAPGDFVSGDKHACYVERGKTTVRIFAELDRATPKRVAKIFVDAYTRA